MSELRNEDPMVFDASVVVNLTGHADDNEFARVLVGRFRNMLPERFRRINIALEEQEFTDAMDSILSLKSAAGTVGTGELFVLSSLIEGHLKRRDFAGAIRVAEDLPAAVERADHALAIFLGE